MVVLPRLFLCYDDHTQYERHEAKPSLPWATRLAAWLGACVCIHTLPTLSLHPLNLHPSLTIASPQNPSNSPVLPKETALKAAKMTGICLVYIAKDVASFWGKTMSLPKGMTWAEGRLTPS